MKPFLRWPGGKRWLSSIITEIIGNFEGSYIEPFLGSGAVLFDLEPSKGCLSDINKKLIDLYRQIRDDPHAFLREMNKHQRNHCFDYYYIERDRKRRLRRTQTAQFLYLNRTCFNGIYRVNKSGKFNVPIGTTRDVLRPEEDFTEISKFLQNFELEACDFEEQVDKARSGDVLYVDPPYTVKHNNNGFLTYNETLFTWADQKRLAASLMRARKRGVKIILSNGNHPSILELYNDDWVINVCRRNSVMAGLAYGRGMTTELLITSEPLAQSQKLSLVASDFNQLDLDLNTNPTD